MAYKKKLDLVTDNAIQLGGSTAGKLNPTKIEGFYLGFKEVDGEYGLGKLHIFQTLKGNVGVWGKTNLNRILTSHEKGMMCQVTFTGMGTAKKGKKPAYEYQLEYDDSLTIDVSGIDLSASEPESLENSSESDVGSYTAPADDDESNESVDESVTYSRPSAPKNPPVGVSSAQQKRVQDLLNKNRTRTV
jgi:hypothetical protein